MNLFLHDEHYNKIWDYMKFETIDLEKVCQVDVNVIHVCAKKKKKIIIIVATNAL